MENRSHRLPPQNIEAEQCVLGSILLRDKALNQVQDLLLSGDFYQKGHRLIYEAVQALSEKGSPIDIVTTTDWLHSVNKLDEAGGAAYVSSLTDIVPVTANIKYYADIVRQKSVLRGLIDTCSEVAARCFDEQDDVNALVDEAEQKIFDLARSKGRSDFTALKDLLKNAFDLINLRFQNKGQIIGCSTGFHDLDRMTSGFQPSDLIILAARPSMGKTALALNIAQHAVIVDKVPTAIFSLEMSNEQLTIRLICSVGKVDSQNLRTGNIEDRDWPNISRAVGMLSEAPLFIDDTPAISILEMRAKARRLHAEHTLGLIIVDYLQLMRGSGPSERREQEISEISRSLKAMAKELNVPVLALSQLNRGVESRTDKRPMLSDLRESGAIEQDADVIMFIYREERYAKDPATCHTRGLAELIIGKQRNGPTGTITLTFVDKYTMFGNHSEREEKMQVPTLSH